MWRRAGLERLIYLVISLIWYVLGFWYVLMRDFSQSHGYLSIVILARLNFILFVGV